MDTVGTLLLRSIADCGPETDDGRFTLLDTSSGNGIVNTSKIAIRKLDITNGDEKLSRTCHRH